MLMFQISTGKYFSEKKKRKHQEKFVFYSNVKVYDSIKIESPDVLIEQVEFGEISCYVVSYTLITEEHPVVIKCGEQDFIQQFLLIWSFFFNCIAKTDKSVVQKICREKKSSSFDQKIAKEISPSIVSLGRNINKEEIDGLTTFIRCLSSTSRSLYKTIISSLRIVDDAKETVSTNFDLAYSTMVYAIESLSQKHDGYIPQWKDFDQEVKKKLEPLLKKIDDESADAIKAALIEGKQFRLRKRFQDFVFNHLDDEFFHKNLGENNRTIRFSLLRRCLVNLYNLRSAYVHELKPLDVMLSSPHSPDSDYIERFGEPYLTYSGLNRILRAVILNFLTNNSDEKVETIDWLSETSSTIIGEMSAKYWIHNADSFEPIKANKWFSTYLDMLVNKEVVDQSSIMSKIESIFDSAKKEFKSPMLHYYWVYNTLHNRDNDKWRSFINERQAFLGNGIHFFVSILYLYNGFSYKTGESGDKIESLSLDDFDTAYQIYLETKFHKNTLSLSGIHEAGLLLSAANISLKIGDKQRFRDYLKQALCELSSDEDRFSQIKESLEGELEVDLIEYFKLKA
jgi:hypothetical protein